MLASQPSLFGELQASERLCLNSKGAASREWHLRLSSVLYTQAHSSVYTSVLPYTSHTHRYHTNTHAHSSVYTHVLPYTAHIHRYHTNTTHRVICVHTHTSIHSTHSQIPHKHTHTQILHEHTCTHLCTHTCSHTQQKHTPNHTRICIIICVHIPHSLKHSTHKLKENTFLA